MRVITALKNKYFSLKKRITSLKLWGVAYPIKTSSGVNHVEKLALAQ